jgi:Beta-galactosidase/beta-glucuronidase
MDRWYRTPKDFESYIYASQVLQGEGVKVTIEAHRRAMPFCMGSLYWQIDDCWLVASWSSIDYYGRWKALHYMAKNSYAPILISPVISEDDVKIHLVSDKGENINVVLDITVLDFDGKVVSHHSIPVSVKPNHSEIVTTLSRSQLVNDSNESRLVFVCRLKKGNEILVKNQIYFRSPKDLGLKHPKYMKRITKTTSGFSIELTANTLTKNVYLTSSDTNGFYSDNYFDLIPRIPKTITVKTQLQQDEFERSLKIISLVDSY